MKIVQQPDGVLRLGDVLIASLADPKWTIFRASVAFVKKSGTKHLAPALAEFSKDRFSEISAGIDLGGTTAEGLHDLLDAVSPDGRVWVFKNSGPFTFHPKVYLFENDNEAQVIVGSGNITEGGLFTNYEASVMHSLDKHVKEHAEFVSEVTSMLNKWSTTQEGTCFQLTEALLEALVEDEGLPTEAEVRRKIKEAGQDQELVTSAGKSLSSMFKRSPVPAAPAVKIGYEELHDDTIDEADIEVADIDPVDEQPGTFREFVMTLQKTDVGVGQTTSGTARRSPEIFVPLAARDADPDFWGWPSDFVEDTGHSGKMDRYGVPVRLGTEIIEVNMMTWPVKHDFRIRSENLRSAGSIGDILRMERTDGSRGFSYYVEIVPVGTSQHSYYLSLCTNAVRNSQRVWGYT